MPPYRRPRPGNGQPCDCPYCCKETIVTDFDLYYQTPNGQGASTYKELAQNISGARFHFSAAHCQHCGGVIIFADGSLCYPTSCAYDTLILKLPANLRKDAQLAIDLMEKAPAVSAVYLRTVLVKLCYLMGLPEDDSADYAFFLRNRLTGSALAALNYTCIQNELCVQPNLVDVARDDEPCVVALLYLIDEII